METTVKYKVVFEPDLTTVHFSGHIDEHIAEVLSDLRPQIKTKRAVFRCEGINLINSIGISTWIAHIKAFDDLDLAYSHLPYNFISLCQMIPVLTAHRTLLSFYVRYECEACAGDDLQFHMVERDESLKLGRFKPMPCSKCHTPMEPDPNDEDLIELFQKR